MAGVKEKMDALDKARGQWTRVGDAKWMNLEGEYLLYNPKTNRLVVSGVVVMLESDGTATLQNRVYKFSEILGAVWRLTRRNKKPTKPKTNEHGREGK